MEQPMGIRASISQIAAEPSDVKERFYRYFQHEATGKNTAPYQL
jgi:hypothetical protein